MKSFKYGKNINLKERPKKSEKGGCVLCGKRFEKGDKRGGFKGEHLKSQN